MYFLTNNVRAMDDGTESHLQALNTSTKLFASQSVKAIENMTIVSTALALVATLGILILLTLILLPLVNHIESNKESVLEVLNSIPVDTIATVKNRYIGRL